MTDHALDLSGRCSEPPRSTAGGATRGLASSQGSCRQALTRRRGSESEQWLQAQAVAMADDLSKSEDSPVARAALVSVAAHLESTGQSQAATRLRWRLVELADRSAPTAPVEAAWARLRLGATLFEARAFDEALTVLQRAVVLLESAEARGSHSHARVLSALAANNLACVLAALHREDESAVMLERARTTLCRAGRACAERGCEPSMSSEPAGGPRSQAGAETDGRTHGCAAAGTWNPGGTADAEVLLTVLSNLGAVAWRRGDSVRSERCMRELLALVCAHDAASEARRAEALWTLGTQLQSCGDADGAAPLLAEATDAFVRLVRMARPAMALPLVPRSTTATHGVEALLVEPIVLASSQAAGREDGRDPHAADSLLRLAVARRLLGRLHEAVDFSGRAVEVYHRIGIVDAPSGLAYAMALHEHARILHELGRLRDSKVPLKQCLRIRESLLAPGDAAIASVLNDLGCRKIQRRSPERGRALLEKSVGIYEANGDARDTDLAVALANLALACHRAGAMRQGRDRARQAERMARRLLGDAHPLAMAARNVRRACEQAILARRQCRGGR